MPDWSNLEEMMKRFEAIRKLFGPSKRRAIPYFEDCVNYPIDQIVALANLAREIERDTEAGPEAEAKIARFNAMLDALQPVSDAKPRIYLWPDKVPTLTEYGEDNFRHNHGADFKPYLIEMLLPENVTPKGAVVLCAGGDHGDATVPEAYQTAMDLNALGYQCFVLLNRTNHSPWLSKEAGVDAARAMRIVRKNAAAYRISPDNVAFAGFSNGGLTGEGLIEYYSGKQTVAAQFPGYVPDELDGIDATPNAFLCVYGPRFNGGDFDWEGVVYPPVFYAIGREDNAIDNFNYVYPDLLAHKVPVEVHTFAGVPHGQAGIRILDGEVKYPTFELWLPLADAFMQDIYRKQ